MKVIINKLCGEVIVNGQEILFTPQEYKLFIFLVEHQNMICTREIILEKIWGYNLDVITRVVDVYVGYLRRKLRNTILWNAIQGRRGFGYRFKVSDGVKIVIDPPIYNCRCNCIYCKSCLDKIGVKRDYQNVNI